MALATVATTCTFTAAAYRARPLSSGLIERSRSTEDRRQLIVELTEEGARQAGLEQAARIKFRSEAFSALTLEEREQLLIMLNKIRNTWEGFDD